MRELEGWQAKHNNTSNIMGEHNTMMRKTLIATLATMWISVAAFAAPISYRLSTPGVV